MTETTYPYSQEHSGRAYTIFVHVSRSRTIRWAAGLVLLPLIITDLIYGWFIPRTWIGGIDLHVYLAGAHIGVLRGWSHIYDGSLQKPLILPYFEHARGFGHGYWTPYVTPPPVAWFLAPFTALPFAIAWLVWSALVVGAVVIAATLLSQPGDRTRPFVYLLLLATPNTILGLVAGNVWAFIFLGITLTWYLARSRREFAAGCVLGICCLKPQVALLVVPALAVAGYWRIVAGFALVAGLMAVSSALSLGVTGIAQWRALASFVSTFHGEASQSLPRLMPTVWLGLILAAAVTVITLAAARFNRRTGPSLPIAIGLVGSLFIAPYLNSYDFVLLVIAGAILVREGRDPALRVSGWVLAFSVVVSGVGLGMLVVGTAMSMALAALLLLSRTSRTPAATASVGASPPLMQT